MLYVAILLGRGSCLNAKVFHSNCIVWLPMKLLACKMLQIGCLSSAKSLVPVPFCLTNVAIIRFRIGIYIYIHNIQYINIVFVVLSIPTVNKAHYRFLLFCFVFF